ncbi:MAG: hypothetical protein OXE78_11460 [Gammaproteobacteria bacterium]|nr:hypothetical protein [Gammaproteobacteria bacterium]MCY4358931.1 hypothetical protein [Gammaproteobacteria bacterium]
MYDRIAMLNPLGLSFAEKDCAQAVSPQEHVECLLETGLLKLRDVRDYSSRDLYLSPYLQTYIERNIRVLTGGEKGR